MRRRVRHKLPPRRLRLVAAQLPRGPVVIVGLERDDFDAVGKVDRLEADVLVGDVGGGGGF